MKMNVHHATGRRTTMRFRACSRDNRVSLPMTIRCSHAAPGGAVKVPENVPRRARQEVRRPSPVPRWRGRGRRPMPKMRLGADMERGQGVTVRQSVDLEPWRCYRNQVRCRWAD